MYRRPIEQEVVAQVVYSSTPIDTIVSTYEGPNFLEVTGRAGGDTLTYRIYDNGSVVER